MDLEQLSARELADELVGTYQDLTGDEDLATLMPFHKYCRAVVRGKVDSIAAAKARSCRLTANVRANRPRQRSH